MNWWNDKCQRNDKNDKIDRNRFSNDNEKIERRVEFMKIDDKIFDVNCEKILILKNFEFFEKNENSLNDKWWRDEKFLQIFWQK